MAYVFILNKKENIFECKWKFPNWIISKNYKKRMELGVRKCESQEMCEQVFFIAFIELYIYFSTLFPSSPLPFSEEGRS